MYLKHSEQTITDFSVKNIEEQYDHGFLFERTERGAMYETRSVRIDLSKFDLSSENKRILKKTEGVTFSVLRLPYEQYTWQIGKLGKDFYETKFGEGVFSANKIKELITDSEKSNFNRLFKYDEIGYAICLETDNILHYSYPFYNQNSDTPNLGIGMMTRAILWAKENNKKYIYLGSAKDEKAKYKLQFSGCEWWDSTKRVWSDDVEELKNIIRNIK